MWLSFNRHYFSPSLPLLKVRVSHEDPRTLEQLRTSESSKGKEVDPRERGVEDFLTMFGSSSSEVCSSSFSYHYFSLSLPLLKAQMSQKEPRIAEKEALKPEDTSTPQKANTPEEPLTPEDEALTSPHGTVCNFFRTLYARYFTEFHHP